jgi:membrane-associated phospholipid phosphatase
LVSYVDRPLATLVGQECWSDLFSFISMSRAQSWIVTVGIVSFVGVWSVVGAAAPGRARRICRLVVSAFTTWAVVEFILKPAFGRADLETWFNSHDYGFQLLQGRPGYFSFPSGHAAVAASMASVFWIESTRWRAPLVIFVFLISVSVVLLNMHFLSDVVAGVFIGWSTAFALCRLLPIPVGAT